MEKIIGGRVFEGINSDKPCKIKRYHSHTRVSGRAGIPKTGLFWIIDDAYFAICRGVDENGNTFGRCISTPSDEWNAVRGLYEVDGKVVPYDYFPRGQVVIHPVKDQNGKFQYFSCEVYGDKCILSDEKLREEIEVQFRLNLSSCKVVYKGQIAEDGTHYTCHSCR